MFRKRLYLFFTCLALCQHLVAQEPAFDTLLLPFIASEHAFTSHRDAQQQQPFLFEQAYAVKGKLTDGLTVRRRLSDSISIVTFRSIAEKQILQKTARILGPVNNLWKLSPDLLKRLSAMPQQKERVPLLITVTDIDAFENRYPPASKEITISACYPATGSLLLSAPASWVDKTALKDPNINFIATTGKPITERELTGFDLSTNKVNLAHRVWPAVNGRGLTVSIKENKMDTADIDFRGRYLFSPAASPTIQTHATTMATIAMGGGNTYYTGKGVAWGASLSAADFANLLPDNIQQLQQNKVTVQNHSYGVGIENYYGADAAAYDAQLAQNPTLMHVFSAGNAGNQASVAGNYAGITAYANLTGSFKMAKNSITVGATDSFGNIAPASSRGPGYDGRLKPELVALGEDGSSGSAAIVSGIALLVQNAWQQKNGVLPPSSITKSVLLNSADDAGPAGIDFLSGYGSANAWRALQTVAESRVLQGNATTGQTIVHSINLPPNARNLKLTLCWIDPPAQANSFKALVNDLDLELSHPGTNQRWLPWVLNSKPAPDSLRQLPVRKRDSLNNAEQITVEIAPAGNYEIMVKGFSITGTQAYAIAWQYDTLAHFIFTYPVKGDNIIPLQTHAIRWETTLTGTANLQYRINTGNWQNMSGAIDLSKKYFQWPAPDSFGALQLRVLVNNKEWRTDTVGLSTNLFMKTGFNCLDSFLVYWQRAAVDSYRVYRLGPQYLEPFAVVTDTALIQRKQNNPYQFFTVAPILPFNTEGVRSYTFNYTQQQVACYISGFIADPVSTNSARLSLQLGTTYQVAKIVFEKLTAKGFVAFRTIAPVITKDQVITETAGNGLNTYRARIELQNGVVYYTKAEQVFIFAGNPYYIFPNPVRQGSALQLLAEDIDNTVFLLYDIHGRKVAEQKVNGFLNGIRLPVLQKGTYYYIILKGGVRQVSEQLLIL